MDYEEDEEFHEAVEYETDCEKLEEVEKATISLNAIADITYYTTMKVRGVHGKRTLYILIDSGSTHNFIDKKVVDMLGCKLKRLAELKCL